MDSKNIRLWFLQIFFCFFLRVLKKNATFAFEIVNYT